MTVMNDHAAAGSPLKPFFALLAVVAVGAIIIGGRTLLSAREIIPWRVDFATAQREAQQSPKPLLAYFTARWCEPCQSLRRTLWSDNTVEQSLRAVVPVKIDIDQNPMLASQYHVGAIPRFILLDESGKSLRSLEGAPTREQFLAWVRR